MDDSNKQPAQETAVTNDKKTKNTIPTIYPDIEYVNRTEN